MKIKRVLGACSAVVLAFSMTACSDSDSSNSTASSNSSASNSSLESADNSESSSQAESSVSSDEQSASQEGDEIVLDGSPMDAEEAEESTEDIPEDVPLSAEAVPLGKDTGLVMNVPEGYVANSDGKCYINNEKKIAVWVQDIETFDTQADVIDKMSENTDGVIEGIAGEFDIYMAEYADKGATDIYVDFMSNIGKYAGIKITVSAEDKNLEKTQSNEIKQMIASISAAQ